MTPLKSAVAVPAQAHGEYKRKFAAGTNNGTASKDD